MEKGIEVILTKTLKQIQNDTAEEHNCMPTQFTPFIDALRKEAIDELESLRKYYPAYMIDPSIDIDCLPDTKNVTIMKLLIRIFDIKPDELINMGG